MTDETLETARSRRVPIFDLNTQPAELPIERSGLDDVATLLPDSLESLIMVICSEYSCDALATAVTELEVDDIVVQTPNCLILLPNKHMVFERLEVKGLGGRSRLCC